MEDLTVGVFATTKGHFGIKNRYYQTIHDLEKHKIDFAKKLAHIKISPDELEFGEKMRADFEELGYKVLSTVGEWSHFHHSHPINQLKDFGTVIQHVNSKYFFNLEDDFLIRAKTENFSFHIKNALNLLKDCPEISQIRIPRESDDLSRYPTRRPAKRESLWDEQDTIFSFNPYLAQTNTIKTVFNGIVANQTQIFEMIEKNLLNGELAFTHFARLLYGKYSFWSFSQKNLLASHVGTKIGEEDEIYEEKSI